MTASVLCFSIFHCWCSCLYVFFVRICVSSCLSNHCTKVKLHAACWISKGFIIDSVQIVRNCIILNGCIYNKSKTKLNWIKDVGILVRFASNPLPSHILSLLVYWDNTLNVFFFLPLMHVISLIIEMHLSQSHKTQTAVCTAAGRANTFQSWTASAFFKIH